MRMGSALLLAALALLLAACGSTEVRTVSLADIALFRSARSRTFIVSAASSIMAPIYAAPPFSRMTKA